MIVYPYIIAFVFFWVGFLTSSMLWAGREKRDAAILGELGRKTEGKLIQGDAEDSHTKSETLVVGEILERKRTPSGRIKKNPKGNQAEV